MPKKPKSATAPRPSTPMRAKVQESEELGPLAVSLEWKTLLWYQSTNGCAGGRAGYGDFQKHEDGELVPGFQFSPGELNRGDPVIGF